MFWKEPGSASARSRATEGFSAITSVLLIAATIAKALDKPYCAAVHPFYFLVGLVSWPVIRLLFRGRAKGLENIPEEGFVLAPNHTSNLDPWPLGIPLWPRRQLNWMAKSELYKPVIGKLITWGGAFPVRRGQGDEGAIDTAVERVQAGEIVVIFPEGTRKEKGLIKRYESRPRTGAARVALRAGRPARPCGDRGHRPSAQARTVARRVRAARRPVRPERRRRARGREGGHRPADGRRSRELKETL